ncbi:dienelactone hydrolase family protein [Croceicoccus marinus]|uniref:Dienelactone hydrolase family protein n=1 Tax=Croceicoccus marinus TaxID=450378 RepID=A0A7G6VUL2_9SPHN|nr:dienelactone hydrolase family protein [Croceicoccus marinus]QNE05427.1 dienelactone hydrolase family protein [Croceicoccus marinus]
MCDQRQLAEMAKNAGATNAGATNLGAINRRSFGAMGGAALLAGCAAATEGAGAQDAAATGPGVMRSQVSIPTAAGTADATFYHPAEGSHPGIIMWPDIAGVRPASQQMAERLAGEGYAVLHPNPYYRSVSGQQFADFAAFMNQEGFSKVGPWREQNTPDAVMQDARAYVAWLDAQDAVDTTRGIGANGHCMTGSWTFYAAAAVPGRVGAAASMHGGGLVTDSPQSPHRMMQPGTSYLAAISQDDDAKQPEAKQALREAAAAVGAPIEVIVYPADHGWTVLDSPAYDREQAERAWAQMLELYAGL